MSAAWPGRPKVNGLTEEPVKLHKCTCWAMPWTTVKWQHALPRPRGGGGGGRAPRLAGMPKGVTSPLSTFTNYRQS